MPQEFLALPYAQSYYNNDPFYIQLLAILQDLFIAIHYIYYYNNKKLNTLISANSYGRK